MEEEYDDDEEYEYCSDGGEDEEEVVSPPLDGHAANDSNGMKKNFHAKTATICSICFQTPNDEGSTSAALRPPPVALKCNHAYCTSCLAKYTEKQLWKNGHRASRIHCLVSGCDACVNPRFVWWQHYNYCNWKREQCKNDVGEKNSTAVTTSTTTANTNSTTGIVSNDTHAGGGRVPDEHILFRIATEYLRSPLTLVRLSGTCRTFRRLAQVKFEALWKQQQEQNPDVAHERNLMSHHGRAQSRTSKELLIRDTMARAFCAQMQQVLLQQHELQYSRHSLRQQQNMRCTTKDCNHPNLVYGPIHNPQYFDFYCKMEFFPRRSRHEIIAAAETAAANDNDDDEILVPTDGQDMNLFPEGITVEGFCPIKPVEKHDTMVALDVAAILASSSQQRHGSRRLLSNVWPPTLVEDESKTTTGEGTRAGVSLSVSGAIAVTVIALRRDVVRQPVLLYNTKNIDIRNREDEEGLGLFLPFPKQNIHVHSEIESTDSNEDNGEIYKSISANLQWVVDENARLRPRKFEFLELHIRPCHGPCACLPQTRCKSWCSARNWADEKETKKKKKN